MALTGAGAGIGAVALTKMLDIVQHVMLPGPNLLVAAAQAGWPRHIGVLLAAGLMVPLDRFTVVLDACTLFPPPSHLHDVDGVEFCGPSGAVVTSHRHRFETSFWCTMQGKSA